MLKRKRFIFVGLSVFMGNFHERASTTLCARANKYKPFFMAGKREELGKLLALKLPA